MLSMSAWIGVAALLAYATRGTIPPGAWIIADAILLLPSAVACILLSNRLWPRMIEIHRGNRYLWRGGVVYGVEFADEDYAQAFRELNKAVTLEKEHDTA